jgi:peptidoglycan/xylan/chitin deacetylase (PgdA/CDA1 family)
VLTPTEYEGLVDVLMQRKIRNIDAVAETVWMSRRDLKELTDAGHAVGLHSFSHPMQMARLSSAEQRSEYQRNFDFIRTATGVTPWSMSHPCNSYNSDTLALLKNMGISTGFCANVKFPDRSGLEYPREDHANVISAIRKGLQQ